MGSTGKHYKDAITRYDRNQAYSGSEALELAASLAGGKFNEGIDLVVRLAVDPRKAEEMIRGTVALPAGTGRHHEKSKHRNSGFWTSGADGCTRPVCCRISG